MLEEASDSFTFYPKESKVLFGKPFINFKKFINTI